MSNPSRFDAPRLRLARLSVAAATPFRSALHDVAVTAAHALSVGRVSVWRFLDGGRSIRCHFLYQPGRPDVLDGAMLHRADFPHYFRALDFARVVAVNDVGDDPVAAEFREAYFGPLGITSMLDAPVYEGSSITAIVCHEHLGPSRVWMADEVAFAAAVADAVARLYDESKLLSARDALGAYRRQVETLRGSGALGRLATGMAHEFGAVLLAAEGNAKLIAGHPAAAAEVSRLAQSVLAATERGHRVVESLLRLGHPTQAKPRVVDVSALLRHAEPLLRMAVGDRVTLDVDPGGALPQVLVDAADLERALIDLAGHARGTMPDGGALRYRALASAPDADGDATDGVTIEVQDDGTGLDAAAAACLFEPFAPASAGAGSTVGLSTVRQALERAGGHVEVDSGPGRGTTIRLSLPGIGPPS